MYTEYGYLNELYHHGIKGQRWGIRRFQNPDGSYTNAGLKRYGFRERRREKAAKELETLSKNYKYLDNSLTKEEADRLARNRQIAKKVLIVGGAVAVASVAGYAGYKYWKHNADEIVKAGTTLQRIEMRENNSLNDKFYAVGGIRDKIKYEGLLGDARQRQADQQKQLERLGLGDGGVGFKIEPYKMKVGVLNNLKIAGNKTGEKLFNELMRKDPEFKDSVRNMKNPVFGLKSPSLYDSFNQAMVGNTENSAAVNKFINYLKKNGYSGIKDVNDQKYSGYNAVNPIIFFNNGKDFIIKENKKMQRVKVDNALNKEKLIQFGETNIKYLSLGIPIATIMTYKDKKTTAKRERQEAAITKKKKQQTKTTKKGTKP